MKPAALFISRKENAVQCMTCAHGCRLMPGQRGICGVRENRDGVLYSLVYGRAAALHVDPVEKKPLFHFLPGASALSLGTVGCNMTCLNCQNSEISQWSQHHTTIPGDALSPEAVVDLAEKQNCRIIAFTYNEPTVFWDYAHDTAEISNRRKIKNIFVTNGYLSSQAVEKMDGLLHGANVDLKSFSDETYRRICGASLEPVLRTIRDLKDRGVWIEVTTLLIPGLNDSEEEMKQIAGFIAGLDQGIPWHISRFYPTYRMLDRPPTSVESIHRACRIGREAGLQFVYAGNVPGDDGENTRCPGCGQVIVRRLGFKVGDYQIRDGTCAFCKTPVMGVWS